MDAAGNITYASPNARSALSRAGWDAELENHIFGEVLETLSKSLKQATDERWRTVMNGEQLRRADFDNELGIMDLLIIPLTQGQDRIGAIVLIHNVTELRRRDQALVTKDATIREIHHRVKNNLQIISSLLEMQANSVDDSNARSALAESQSRVISMAIIHQKLYQDEILDSIDFRSFAETLYSQLKSMSGNRKQEVRLINDLPEINIKIDLIIPLGLILNELITNTLKYALSATSVLSIHLNLVERDSYFVLIYHDSGQGLPEGFDFEKSSSMGMQLIYRLSNQIGGYAEYVYEGGSTFNIHFLDGNS